jgi:hypothetical protein
MNSSGTIQNLVCFSTKNDFAKNLLRIISVNNFKFYRFIFGVKKNKGGANWRRKYDVQGKCGKSING